MHGIGSRDQRECPKENREREKERVREIEF